GMLGSDSGGNVGLGDMGAGAGQQTSANAFISAMMARGWSKEAAAMMAGNVSGESSFNTGSVGDGGTSFGLVQWHGDRARKLQKFAASKGKPWTDPDVQYDFLDQEFRSRYGANAVQSHDMNQLAPLGKAYEGYATNTYAARVGAANRFLQNYQDPAATNAQ